MLEKIDKILRDHQRIVWGVIITAFAILSLRCLHQSVDDMYIVFRYVENIVNGHGFVFNVGERVEGYTSFMWVVMLTAFVKMGIPVDFAAKGLSVLFGGICLLLVYRIGKEMWREHYCRELLSFLPLCLLAVNPVFEYWVVGGLATMLYCSTILAAMLLLLMEARFLHEGKAPSERNAVFLGFICAVAFLTRPEGAVLVAFVFVVMLLLLKFRGRWMKHMFCFTVTVAVPAGCFLIWRYSYYNDWLPNTYYAKMTGSWSVRVFNGWYYLLGTLSLNGLGWMGDCGETAWIGMFLFFVLPIVLISMCKHDRRWWIIFAGNVVFTLIAVWEGGDWMPYGRFLLPSVITWMLLLVFSAASAELIMKRWRKARIGRLAFVSLLCFILFLGGDYFKHSIEMKVAEMNRPEAWPAVFARTMTDMKPKKGLIAISDIGLLSYLSKYRVIDMVGLVDRHVARTPGPSCQKDYDISYVLDQDPDFIVVNSRFLPDTRMRADPRFLSGYEFVREQTSHSLYVRREK